jgi:putative flippase GtrA
MQGPDWIPCFRQSVPLGEEYRMQFIRFGLVGFANTLIDFGILNLLLFFADYPAGPGLVLCNSTAFFFASINSYMINKNWTFSDRRSGTVSHFGLFMVVTIAGLAINSGILYLLTLPAIPPAAFPEALWINIAKLMATAASMLWNFCSYRWFVFRAHCLPR